MRDLYLLKSLKRTPPVHLWLCLIYIFISINQVTFIFVFQIYYLKLNHIPIWIILGRFTLKK